MDRVKVAQRQREAARDGRHATELKMTYGMEWPMRTDNVLESVLEAPSGVDRQQGSTMKLLVLVAVALSGAGAIADGTPTTKSAPSGGASLSTSRPLPAVPSGPLQAPRFQNSTRGKRPFTNDSYKPCRNSTFLGATPNCCSFGPGPAECAPAAGKPKSAGDFISICQPPRVPKCCFTSLSGTQLCLGYVDG
ncbi:hypothetical protein XA68_15852 [Ophiocordyceps unilateralis]|uniref:Hydrophobin n=1 Tax=Ophiocordyceps unilateralis TaxID=268505 RepID=A0A2A9P7E8_OPHUN|nr:hypothetical protein XA68_15852 [Ophiocordyceps unilateralis]